MNNGRPSGPRRPTGRPVQNPGGRPVRPNNGQSRRPVQPPRPNMNDALNEHYEEMVAPRADGINRGKYADLSTFESKGHRRIDPAIMRARKRKELIRRYLPIAVIAAVLLIALWVYLGLIRPASLYDKAVALFEGEDYSSAEEIFEGIYDYKDSSKFVAYIDARAAYKSGDYSTAKTIYVSLGDFYDSAALAAKSEAKLSGNDDNKSAYEAASELYEKGDYAEAKKAFEALGSYLDSSDKAALCDNEIKYAEAVRLLSIGKRDEARDIFLSLGSFRDSATLAKSIENGVDTPPTPATEEERYQSAKADFEAGKLSSANLEFYALGEYKDSKKYTDYTYAVMCAAGGDYGTAYVCFGACGDFLDAEEKTKEAGYNYASGLYSMQDASKLPEVIRVFGELGSYSDSADMLYAAKDQYKAAAIFAYNDGDKAGALSMFESLSGHPECDEWAERIRGEMQK